MSSQRILFASSFIGNFADLLRDRAEQQVEQQKQTRLSGINFESKHLILILAVGVNGWA